MALRKIMGDTHNSYGAEKVDIENGSPLFWGEIGNPLHGRQDSMVDYHTVDLREGFEGNLHDLGAHL